LGQPVYFKVSGTFEQVNGVKVVFSLEDYSILKTFSACIGGAMILDIIVGCRAGEG
jgi:hypothetical protein